MRKIRESNENAIRAKRKDGDVSIGAMRIMIGNVLMDKEGYVYLKDIAEKLDIYDVMVSVRYFKGYDSVMRLYACWLVEQLPIPTDDKVFTKCLETAKAFASGRIHEHEMRMANHAAWDHKTDNYSNYFMKKAMHYTSAADVTDCIDVISMECSYAYSRNEYDEVKRMQLWNESKDKQRAELIRICECVENKVSPYPELLHIEQLGFKRDY